MQIFLVVLLVLVAAVLVLIVLAQDSKSGALSPSSGANQIVGVRKSGDIMEKLTWGFAVGLVAIVLSTGFILSGDAGADGLPRSVNIEKAKASKAAPAPAALPAAPAQQGAQPAQGTQPTQDAAQPATQDVKPADAPANQK